MGITEVWLLVDSKRKTAASAQDLCVSAQTTAHSGLTFLQEMILHFFVYPTVCQQPSPEKPRAIDVNTA
jgi:hypothetical protein